MLPKKLKTNSNMGVGPFPGQVAQCQLKDQLKREIFLYLSLFHCSSWMFLAALAALYPPWTLDIHSLIVLTTVCGTQL